jgi:membrane protease YdiL (CAAX protease family)
MNSLLKRLQQHLWLAFFLHQAFIFAIAFLFLSAVRRVTGKTIHGGRDPVGWIDGMALIVISILVIFLTKIFYHWIKGKDAPSLGISLSRRRVLDVFVGTLIGCVLVASPWIGALWFGTATIQDRIGNHFNSAGIARVLTLAWFLLLVSSLTEEVANRGFPMRLWEHRSLAFRMIIPSIFFAALHLADEDFAVSRFGILFVGGLVQSFAYALTGNIWFTSGVHTGANLAAFSVTGLWHAGAVFAVVGQPLFPNWIAVMLMLIVFSGAFFIGKERAWISN